MKHVRLLAICIALLTSITPSKAQVNYDEVSLGVGGGFDHAGLGIKLQYYPTKNIAPYVGFGYNLLDASLSVGVKFRLLNSETPKYTPYLFGNWGYTTVFRIINDPSLDMSFNGPSFGIGIDSKIKEKSIGYWSLALTVPIRGQQIDDYIEELKDKHGVIFLTTFPPVGISVGFNFILSRKDKE